MSLARLLILGIFTLAIGLPARAAPGPFESATVPTATCAIDEAVFGKLQRLHIEPANVCSDAVFVRRAYLDTIGTLPTGYEAREFILSREANKRHALIERLLAQDEFADYWAMKWSDLLRIKAEFPINLWPNAAQAYHHWVHNALKQNLPYHQFVRELLTASGSNFRVGQVNFYRAMQSKDPAALARTVALTFMGVRAEQWPKERLAGMTAFFAEVGYKSTQEWKEEIVFFDPDLATNAASLKAVFPDGAPAQLSPERDPREVFADWLIQAKNPWFARNLVNRVWAWLLGRGIIHEPDDIRPDNPPSNPELLTLLEREFVKSHYDVKQLFRLILNSQTYQLSCVPKTESPEAEANFAYYPLRRLEAEVLIDALNQLTGSSEKYSSPIPEPFTYIPDNQRSISLPDGSISSSFLEMFGRPPRDTGLESERNNRPSAAQELFLLNSGDVQRKLEQSRMIQFQSQAGKTRREIANGLYLGILSRFPTQAELAQLDDYGKAEAVRPREAAVDIAWALINSAEFLYRH